MKAILMISLLSLFAMTAFTQSKQDKKDVEAVVANFANSADQQDVAAMTAILDENFRAVINRQLGSDQMLVVSKEDYLSLLEAKKLGGDERKVTILDLDINGDNASVKTELDGMALTFTTYLLLARDRAGIWRVVQDMPTIAKK